MAGTRRVHPDVVFERHSLTLVEFWCNTSATEWVRENVQVPDYMWRGSQNFLCETGHVDMLIAGLEEAGFKVLEG